MYKQPAEVLTHLITLDTPGPEGNRLAGCDATSQLVPI